MPQKASVISDKAGENLGRDVKSLPTASHRPSARANSSLLSASFFWVWAANLLVGAAVLAWLFFDPRFEASVSWWQFQFQLDGSNTIRDMGDWRWLGARNLGVIVIAVTGLLSAVCLFQGMVTSSQNYRTIHAWLMIATSIGFWTAVIVNWQDVTWLGKQHRIGVALTGFDAIVSDLQKRWPDQDGERKILGPFMAYPVDSPRTLILLTLPEFDHTTTSCCVVEGGGNVLRFELVGAESGDWIEWHPSDSVPADFFSGLGEVYQLERSQRLTEHWYLVRYER